MTINSNKKEFLVSKGLWKGEKLWNLYDKAKTPYEWHPELFAYAKRLKLHVSAHHLMQKQFNCWKN